MSPNDLGQWLNSEHRHALVMGVLNTTPDSFSDGGRYLDQVAARDRVRAMLDEGADWIDVGGESTRPGSQPVDDAEQLRRIEPAIREAVKSDVVVSVDTASAAVASAALDMGAHVVNDVTAGGDPKMFAVMARADACVLMHMRGDPRTMQNDPTYDDVVAEVERHLLARRQAAIEAGVEPHRILLDPGIGFGKTLHHNLALLAATRRFASLDAPLLIGTSRKRFIGVLTRRPLAEERVMGTAATVAWAVAGGASVVRVHDVRAMREVVDVIAAIQRPDRVDPALLA